MTCIEIGDLMQRQLDDDLDEYECVTLKSHLAHCEECNQIFERLTMLSGNLEQLPLVTPPISIVDSILLDLETIDQQRANEQQNKFKRKKLWYTSISSVAAAALVIVITSILNPGANQSADQSIAIVPESSQGETRILNPTDVTPTSARIASDEPNSHQEDKTLTVTSRESNDKHDFTFDSMSIQNNDNTIQHNDNAQNNTNNMDDNTVSIKSNQNSSDFRNEQSDFVQRNNMESSSSDDFNGPYTLESITEVTDQYGEMTGIESALPPPDFNSLDVNTLGVMNNSTNNFYSSDEVFYLVIDENIISIYETSSNVLRYEFPISKQENDFVQFGSWATDNSGFSYYVIDQSGASHEVFVKIND